MNEMPAPAQTRGSYRLVGSPAVGLAFGTWGFFIGFAAVALYGPAAKYFQEQMHLGGLALGLLVAAPQLTGSLLRISYPAGSGRPLPRGAIAAAEVTVATGQAATVRPSSRRQASRSSDPARPV